MKQFLIALMFLIYCMFTGYNKQKEILIYKNLANSGMTEHITLTLSMSQKNI